MRIKLFKNLYQTLSLLLGIAFFDISFIIGFVISLFMEQPNYGWVLLVIIPATFVLYFVIGFYWIFQTVTLDEKGIRVKFFGKTLKELDIKDIDCFTIGILYRNPIIAIQRKDGTRLNLDKRKKTIDYLKSYNIEYRESL